jgi:hypothetical protein
MIYHTTYIHQVASVNIEQATQPRARHVVDIRLTLSDGSEIELFLFGADGKRPEVNGVTIMETSDGSPA